MQKENLGPGDFPKLSEEALADYVPPTSDELEDRPAEPASQAEWHRNAHRMLWALTRFIDHEWLGGMVAALDTLDEWSEQYENVWPASVVRDACVELYTCTRPAGAGRGAGPTRACTDQTKSDHKLRVTR